ncbi:MAG TPA: ATP-binding protein, partial [Chthonomonadaceae bacterium]|nr:ATP-binding protein [Chthonomonadaceae bacterium]
MNWLYWAVCLGSGAAAGYLIRMVQQRAQVRALEETQHRALEAASERQQAEGRLQTLQQEYDALLVGCGAGVLILNSSDHIERANRVAGHLLGTSAQSLVGKSLLEATLSSELNSLVKTAREKNVAQHREVRTSGLNGQTLSVTALPIGNGTAEKYRFVVIAQDVTELRRLETVRRDFVANVSHELRTPLATIRAMAETLQDGALEDDSVSDHFLGTINAEAQRLTRISEDLLILSQAESRQPEKEPFNLSLMLTEVVSRFQPQAEKGLLTLCAEVPPALQVIANHDQIEQVLVNLVDNALKYTPPGGRILVTAEKDEDILAVHVSDTGIGIQSQDVPRIFERFYRVDKHRSRQSGGTGLGLSIVKHIVEAHSGQVTVDSEYNRGSVFTFT